MTQDPGGEAGHSPRARTGSSWPVGRLFTYRNQSLSRHLWVSGTVHARRALSTFGPADPDAAQLTAISVGCAVELLSKSLVAATAPALLTEAVATATHLYPGLAWRKEPDSIVFQVRNAAAHMGLVDAGELHTAMLTMLRYVDSALTVKAESARTFWGEDLAALASELLSEAMTQRRRIVAAKQAAARAMRPLARLSSRL
jgi:hypothetical protein